MILDRQIGVKGSLPLYLLQVVALGPQQLTRVEKFVLQITGWGLRGGKGVPTVTGGQLPLHTPSPPKVLSGESVGQKYGKSASAACSQPEILLNSHFILPLSSEFFITGHKISMCALLLKCPK